MSGATCNTWKALAFKLALVLVGVVSFVAVTFASVTWARGEGREKAIATACERIRANEVRGEAVEKRLDRFDAKLDAIGTAVHAKMPAEE